MEHVELRRKAKRISVRWKAAVVFDKAEGKPILHTQTLDLSVGGVSIHSDYADLTGSMVTLLLAQPARSGEAPKMLKLRAQVVSSVHWPTMSGFRHGLKFVPAKDDGLDVLAGILGAAESAPPGAEAATVAPAVTAAAAPQTAPQTAPQPAPRAAAPPEPVEAFKAAPGGLLAQLRQAAQAKLMEEQNKSDPKEQMIPRVSAAVEMVYRYLKEFAGPLHTEKPAYAKEYSIGGLLKFDGLKWAEAQADFRTRELSPTSKVFEQATLNFRLSAGKTLSVVREIPADEKLKQTLTDARIAFTTMQERSARGSVVGTKFVVPCEVNASLQLLGNFDTGKLLLKMRNIEHFGTLEHVLSADAISDTSLGELTKFILGETRRIGPLLLKDA